MSSIRDFCASSQDAHSRMQPFCTEPSRTRDHATRRAVRQRPRSGAKAKPNPTETRAQQKRNHRRLGLVSATLFVAAAVSVVIWSESRPGKPAIAADAGYEVSGDLVHVNNRECAMGDSPIAEKDLGRFASRVTYDGPIEQFQGKTLVFNQCCAKCIDSFPEKWAAERDQIIQKFGLAQTELR